MNVNVHAGNQLQKFVVLCALAALQPALLFAQQSGGIAVFRIGEFNKSSAELAPGQPKQPVEYVVGKSTAAKDWYASQPAVLASAAASAASGPAAPRTISFALAAPLAHDYSLRVSLLLESPAAPALRIIINGSSGILYPHPKLDYSSGDQNAAFNPVYSAAEVDFDIPAEYLHAGANTIALQAVEEASEEVPGAGITYDAVELDKSTTAAPAVSAELVPTIFFHQQATGLAEEVDVFVRHSRPIASGSSIHLALAGEQYQQPLSSTNNLGDEKIVFLVKEFFPQSQAHLTLQIGGAEAADTQTISPQKHWTIFIVPHIHVDIGYSDYQAKVAAIQARTIDEAMDMAKHHPEFRFSLDGEWDLQQFLETRTPEEQKRVITAIGQQKIYVPAQYANLLTGLPSTETLIRSLYPSANFSRTFGTPFNYANITDVPAYSWSYPSILAAAGLHDLVAASNNYRAPVLLQGRLNEDSPAWWVGPDGNRVLLWYSRIYFQMGSVFGLPPLLDTGRDMLPIFLQQYQHPGYRASAAIIYGTQVENTDLFPQQAELAGKWNSTYAWPRIQYSGFHDALENIAKQFGGNIPSIRGDDGPYWEDGAASDAYYLGMERWTEPRAQTAEKFSTLASIINPRLKANANDLGHMWTSMVLMDEHTWDSYNSVSDPTSTEATSQLAIKEQFAVNAAAQADFIVKRSMANLADAISVKRDSLIIFNSLNWQRSGPVTVDIGRNDEIVDTVTAQVVPLEVLSSGHDFLHVRFQAQDIPALGYKVYFMRHTDHPATAPRPEPQPSATLESPYYRVTLDPQTGAVRSIYDKQLQRELVNAASPYRFGQYLYVTGGDKSPNSILNYSPVNPHPQLTIHAAHNGKLISVERMPTGTVARMQSDDLNTPAIVTEIRLFDHEKKIEFVENVDKTEVTTKEGVYFAFPFAMSAPQFQYEIQNGVVDPSKDMYPGAGHEWFTAQHWVSVQQNGLAATVMPLDAPMITLGDINRGAWPESFGARPGNIFSYIMNNYWDTNYRAGQGGHFTFHYIVTSAATTDAAALSRMAWQEVTPLENDTVTSQDKAVVSHASTGECGGETPLDAKQAGMITVSDPNLLLETWKPAENGSGTILRFLDFGGTERTVTITTPYLHLHAIQQTDAVERDQHALPLSGDQQFQVTIHPHEILTLRAIAQQPDCAGH